MLYRMRDMRDVGYNYLFYISSIDKYHLYKTAGEEWTSCHNCYKISVAPYPDSAHSFKDKCLLLLASATFETSPLPR